MSSSIDTILNKSCPERIGLGLLGGFVFGGFLGASKTAFMERSSGTLAINNNQSLLTNNNTFSFIKRGFQTTVSTSLTFGLIGATYTSSECLFTTARGGKEDSLSSAFGGATTGVVIGLLKSSLKVGISSAALLSIIAASLHYTGGFINQTENNKNRVLKI